LQLSLGAVENFELEEVPSKYAVPELKVFFSESLADFYKPIIFEGNEPLDKGDQNKKNNNNVSKMPDGIYYRMVYSSQKNEFCIQYYVYWLSQHCTDFIGISNHKYDYEPILIFVVPPEPFPTKIVNSGHSKYLGLNHCRFHKIEARSSEYLIRDDVEEPVNFTTSPSPFYPFGGKSGLIGTNCVKKYPISGAIYLENYNCMFGIDTCFHAFSGAEPVLKGQRLNIPLKRLDDLTLEKWFWHHYKEPEEEPFGHDVSNPFEFPFIKYVDPKAYLEDMG